MTREEAIKELAANWQGCHDAAGLLMALERMGAVTFDETVERRLVKEAKALVCQPGSLLPVDLNTVQMLANLVRRLAVALEGKHR